LRLDIGYEFDEKSKLVKDTSIRRGCFSEMKGRCAKQEFLDGVANPDR